MCNASDMVPRTRKCSHLVEAAGSYSTKRRTSLEQSKQYLRDTVFIFLQTLLEKKKKKKEIPFKPFSPEWTSIFVEFCNYFLESFFLTWGHPIKFIVLRGLFCLSQHLSKLSEETQKTIANFSNRVLTGEIWALPLYPGACICIPK